MQSMLLSTVVGMSALVLPLAGPRAARADEAPAVVRVTLPADATLTIDGRPTTSTSADRTFVTPPLEAGRDFHYTMRAKFVRNGETVTVERRVAVRAGEETNVSLASPAAGEEAPALSYSPSAPVTPSASFDYPASPPRGYVGGARDNWKPDLTDPFHMGDDW